MTEQTTSEQNLKNSKPNFKILKNKNLLGVSVSIFRGQEIEEGADDDAISSDINR